MRTSGVLMPISSLPSPYGIGTMGKSARKFVDFLVKGGQTYWQILQPRICCTGKIFLEMPEKYGWLLWRRWH